MADNFQRYGFRWKKSRTGPNLQPERFRVASAYQATDSAHNLDLWVGDPVKKVNDGTVALAAAGDALFGVIVGIGPYYNSGIGAIVPGGPNLPGATAYSNDDQMAYVYIVPVAGQEFECVCDDNTTATTKTTYLTYIGENVNHSINSASGDTHAYPQLHITGHATTNTLTWRIVDVGRSVNIDYTGKYVPLIVTANVVQQAPFQATGV